MGEQMVTHFDSLRYLFKELRTEEQLDALKAKVLEELRTKPGIMCSFYMAMARKARDSPATASYAS
jgi:hypothetical protein